MFAMLGLSEALDQEVGPAGIRVIALCPGTVNTEMMQRSLAEWSPPDGRSADEIARAHYFSRAALQRWVERRTWPRPPCSWPPTPPR